MRKILFFVFGLMVISNRINAQCWRKIAVSSSALHTIAIAANGTLWAWGFNQFGQLGNGNTTLQTSPIQIGSDTNWQSVASGSYSTIAIKTDGTLWAWGYNKDGQLGNGNTTQQNSPVQIGSAVNWQSVACGIDHTIAIKTDGTLWSWGGNFNGQLGNGNTTQQNSPVQIGNATNWKSAAGGLRYTIAIKTDGTLWAWGRNSFGQLGNGNTTQQSSPVQIGSANNWYLVACGSNHTLAIKTDSTLWAWGSNSLGQLGNGSYTNQNIPMQIGVANNWQSVAGGLYHTVSTKTNGTLWSWGANSEGQLGIGNATSQTSPMQIGLASNWSAAFTGEEHSLSLKIDGSLQAWGANYVGQLGDNSTTKKNVPTAIACPINAVVIFEIKGTVRTPKSNSIKKVTINYTGTTTGLLTADTSGNFNCILNTGGNYTLRPTKNNDIAKANGINATDVLFTQRHILNITKLNSAYKLIAADVNGDKNINATDVLRIKRLILGIDTTFTSATKGNRLWEFVDSAYIFPDTTNPFPFKDSISFTNLTSNKINQTFIGVKLGDVNYDWNPLVAKGVEVKPVELVYTISNEQLAMSNSVVRIPITVKNFKDLAAMQYTLHFDHTKYEFVGIENNNLNIDFNSKQATENGNITMLWTDKNAVEKTLEDGTELFVLVLQSTVNSRLSTDLKLTLTNDITDISAWDKDFTEHSIILSKQKTINDKAEQWSVNPNPTSGDVKVNIVSKVNKAVSFELTDAQGKTILKQVVELQKGNNNFTMNLKKNGNLATGIYFLKAVGIEGEIVKRIMVK